MLYFLSLADSHAFNKALLLRILKEIAKFEFGMTASNLNHTMLKLRLLAKFLGVLTFGHHLKDLDAMWDPKFGESAADQCRIYQGELLDPLRDFISGDLLRYELSIPITCASSLKPALKRLT